MIKHIGGSRNFLGEGGGGLQPSQSSPKSANEASEGGARDRWKEGEM